MVIKQTIEEWGIITGIQILDPDGFDRKDPKLMENKYTLKEFISGAMLSTCQWRKGSMILMDALLEEFR